MGRRVLGISRACSVQQISTSTDRHAIERMEPVDYLRSSYYERWLDRNIRLLVEKGVITREELERRMPSGRTVRIRPRDSDPKLLDRMFLLRVAKERTPYRQPGPAPRSRAAIEC